MGVLRRRAKQPEAQRDQREALKIGDTVKVQGSRQGRLAQRREQGRDVFRRPAGVYGFAGNPREQVA